MVPRIFALAVAVMLVAPAIGLVSCSSNSSHPTNPAPAAELNGNLSSTGAQYPHTFTRTGSFPYQCTVHPACVTLQGTIVVVDTTVQIQNRVLAITIDGGSAGGPYGGGSCSSLSRGLDTVRVNDQVTWTNNSPLPHTVTSR